MRLTLSGTLAATAAGALVVALAPTSPASAMTPAGDPGAMAAPTTGVEQECFTPDDDLVASARGGQAHDHRSVSAKQQRRIEARTERILAAKGGNGKGKPGGGGGGGGAVQVGGVIPVYVHVMAASNGAGDVSDAQIAAQVDVLNATYAGQESSAAPDTSFSFTLAGTDRFYNNTWHQDGASSKYRKATRQGGADALNVWLVDFDYLGVATFPWDYARNGGIDGVRVQYDSLPGGGIPDYDLGKTATHEVGHWLGLYHTFQGGCTSTNDEVSDTPAQSSPTSGCPEGRDSCSLPGLDPIHNYMDYSFDACYDRFSAGQSTRMSEMFSAYRA
ncbi:zinc metalloprotease [Nocardioides sp.]|jgi:hypothetical protein|uniref:zinc metalloprotease n=1 Tax=Nocardioides sp. TaxID=35761 RepID=UPI001D5B1AE7|nr:zinc metalloprotease [Nocardioides sp.]MBU1802533.1 zinc metalloprotease [Actinomycetota bacterium]